MKVAIIHYWLVNMRGGEKVIEALLDIYPEADIYTHVIDPEKISEKIRLRVAGTTFIQKLPKAIKYYQSYLPLMPYALEQLDLRQYDLIISSESGPAKGVITSPNALHICYCHSPMRYVWDMYHDYRDRASFIKRLLMPILMHRLRLWDLASSFRVDHFIANSSFVQKRINKFYRRESTVIFPPINVEEFYQAESIEDFYLIVGQLVAYKNTRLAIEAFNKNGKPLIIIGAGDELEELKKIAQPNISILGYQNFDVIKHHYAHCKALVFPSVEDFGMVPVEAMASGRPIIALRKGGALDTVLEGISGVFFDSPTILSLNNAINKFELSFDKFDSKTIQKHAKKFDTAAFTKQFQELIQSKS
ncbi:MAG: glycosyltransferase [Methylococcaceae bacterium]|nr:glycosyltransferase [Methylococcaceae bacterium]